MASISRAAVSRLVQLRKLRVVRGRARIQDHRSVGRAIRGSQLGETFTDILSKPEWIPYYIQRMKGSKAFKELKDYQFGWYSKLLIELADSDVPGYLPNEVSDLWKLAGAQTEYYFRKHGGIELLARWFNRTEDGRWIYNVHMLKVLHEQGKKLTKRRKHSLSSLLSVVQGLPDWIPSEEFGQFMEMRKAIGKELTPHAVKLAVSKLETLKGQGHEPKAVLEQSIFNGWQGLWPLHEDGANGAANGHKEPGTTPKRSPEQENCATCGGQGWDLSSGKAKRCACRQTNKAPAKTPVAT